MGVTVFAASAPQQQSQHVVVAVWGAGGTWFAPQKSSEITGQSSDVMTEPEVLPYDKCLDLLRKSIVGRVGFAVGDESFRSTTW